MRGKKNQRDQIREFAVRVLELLYPIRCPVCGMIPEYGMDICPECRVKLQDVMNPVCMKCGKPVADPTIELCYDCSRKQHVFRAARAVFVYDGEAKASLYRFKYAGRQEYAAFYARETIKKYGHWIAYHPIDAIIPVPLHWKRKRKRGYNQAALYARELGKITGLPVWTNILRRVVNTRPQKELDDRERKNNLKNAFKCEKSIVQSKYILLVDDIYTTGSTVDMAASELMRAGAAGVFVICISIGGGL